MWGWVKGGGGPARAQRAAWTFVGFAVGLACWVGVWLTGRCLPWQSFGQVIMFLVLGKQPPGGHLRGLQGRLTQQLVRELCEEGGGMPKGITAVALGARRSARGTDCGW